MADNSPAPRDSRKIPPLAWIILAVLVVLGAIMVFGPSRVVHTPSGGSVPAVAPPVGDTSGQAPSK
jgi:hypothetical protein